MEFINQVMNKKALNNLLAQVYLEYGGSKAASLANSLKNLGYKYATLSGTTISLHKPSDICRPLPGFRCGW